MEQQPLMVNKAGNASMREFRYPLVGGEVTIKVPFPMSEENYSLLSTYITASKAALTKKDEAEG